MTRPDNTEYAPYYHQYISQVPDEDVIQFMSRQLDDTLLLLDGISEDRAGYRYAEGKWSVRELVGHLIDTERIFTYRALRIARGDKAELPGFDQDEYVKNARSDGRTLANLAEEFRGVRRSTLALLETLNDDECARMGRANGYDISVRGVVYSMAGHEVHHKQVLRERYLLTD